jgi:hypothetical protein
MFTGVFAMLVGFVAIAATEASGPAWQIAAATFPIGVGSAIAGPAVPIAILAALPPECSGAASGIASALRQVAATIGVALFGALLVGRSELAEGMQAACWVAVVTLVMALRIALRCVRPAARASSSAAPA